MTCEKFGPVEIRLCLAIQDHLKSPRRHAWKVASRLTKLVLLPLQWRQQQQFAAGCWSQKHHLLDWRVCILLQGGRWVWAHCIYTHSRGSITSRSHPSVFVRTDVFGGHALWGACDQISSGVITPGWWSSTQKPQTLLSKHGTHRHVSFHPPDFSPTLWWLYIYRCEVKLQNPHCQAHLQCRECNLGMFITGHSHASIRQLGSSINTSVWFWTVGKKLNSIFFYTAPPSS